MSFVYYIATIIVVLAFVYSLFRQDLCSWYKNAFACFTRCITPGLNKLTGAYKLDIFARLHEAKPEYSLEILEIGAGTGANFSFLPSGCNLTCVEPNGHMHSHLRETYEHFKNVFTIKQIVNWSAEDMSGVSDASMDAVIATFVLCSISDLRKCIAEVWRVLKPGGQFCYVEHTADSNKSSWIYASQKLFHPVWRFVCDGCDTLGDPQAIINEAGFSDVIYNTAYMDTIFKPTCHVTYGVATK